MLTSDRELKLHASNTWLSAQEKAAMLVQYPPEEQVRFFNFLSLSEQIIIFRLLSSQHQEQLSSLLSPEQKEQIGIHPTENIHLIEPVSRRDIGESIMQTMQTEHQLNSASETDSTNLNKPSVVKKQEKQKAASSRMVKEDQQSNERMQLISPVTDRSEISIRDNNLQNEDDESSSRNMVYYFLFTKPHLLHFFLKSFVSSIGNRDEAQSQDEQDEDLAMPSAQPFFPSMGLQQYQSMGSSSSLSDVSASVPVPIQDSIPVSETRETNLTVPNEHKGIQESRLYSWTGIGLRSSSLPISNERSLRRVLHAIHFGEGVKTMTGTVWPMLYTGLLMHDLIQYYRLPSFRYGNTLKCILFGTPTTQFNQNIWSGFFDSEDVLPGYGHFLAVGLLLGIPITWGLIRLLRYWPYMTALTDKENPEDFERHFSEEGCCHDISTGHCVGPGIGLSHHWTMTATRLLWNGQIPVKTRKELFDQVKKFAKGSNRLAQFYAISTLAHLVDYGKQSDWEKLNRHLPKEEQEEERALASYIQHESIQTLSELSDYEVTESHTGQKNRSLMRYGYTHYQRWKLGLMKERGRSRFVLEPVFWLIQLYGLYTQYRYWERVIANLILGIQSMIDQRRCQKAGKQWGVRPEKAQAKCSVCGDLDIYIGDIDDSDRCWNGFLSTPRKPEEIVQESKRYLGHSDISSPQSTDFVHQPWTNWTTDQFDGVMDALSYFETLPIFNLSRLVPDTDIDQVDDGKMKRLGQFLQQVPTKKVSLKNQNIGASGMKELSSGLSQNSTEFLDVSNTAMDDSAMKAVAPELQDSALRFLSVADNQIGSYGMQTLSSYLLNSSLTELDASHNKFETIGCDALFASIAQHPLQLLRIGSQDLTQCTMATIGLAFNTLVSLKMPNAQLQNVQLLALGPYLANTTSLTDLDISQNRGTDYGWISFLKNLSPHQRSLNLSQNKLGDNALNALKMGLPTELDELDISGNHFSVEGLKNFFQQLPKTKIRVLKISDIGDEGADALAQVIPHLSFLEVLDVSHSSLSATGAKSLLEALPGTPVQLLLMNQNAIGDSIAPIFKQVLPQTNVTRLEVAANDLTDVTLKALNTVKQLRVLRIGQNQVGDEGALDLAQHLIAPIPHPEKLSDNTLSRDETRAINSAKPATRLTQLDLTGNQLTASGARALCRAWPIAQNTVDQLQLDQNPIDSRDVNIKTCRISSIYETTSLQGNLFWHPFHSDGLGADTSRSLASSSSDFQSSSNTTLPFAIMIIGGLLLIYWFFAPGIRFVQSLTGYSSKKNKPHPSPF